MFSMTPGSVCAHVVIAPAAAVGGGGCKNARARVRPVGRAERPVGSVPVAQDCAHLPTHSGAVLSL